MEEKFLQCLDTDVKFSGTIGSAADDGPTGLALGMFSTDGQRQNRGVQKVSGNVRRHELSLRSRSASNAALLEAHEGSASCGESARSRSRRAAAARAVLAPAVEKRSEERRVGKEGGAQWR